MHRLHFAHLPTPLWHRDSLDRLVGTELWLKRDDFSAGAAAGNKIRKLEFLLADAARRQASCVITCGAEQSNHARATALLAAELGMKAHLLLRTGHPERPPPTVANLLIDRLVGATIRWLSPEQYENRDQELADEAAQLATQGERPYIIPEGGSNGLGALGYVEAMREVREQLDLGLAGSTAQFDTIVTACGSGGTAAGTALGASAHGVAHRVDAIAVSATTGYFQAVTERIVTEARALEPRLGPPASLVIHDRFRGPAYAVASREQLEFMVEVMCKTGLLLDPVYTGKALYGLSQFASGAQKTLFLHTGGLPGALAEAEQFLPLL